MNFKENKSELLGVFFFIMAIAVFGFMMYIYVKYPFSSIDEGYTRGIVNLSIPQMIDVTSIDVHPPLYYLLVMGLMSIVSVFNGNVELIYIMKFVSIIPAILLLILSATKIRKDYGLFAAGLFSFFILAMSKFFIFYLTARMYSWAVLFLILSFICVREILVKGDLKYWILLSIFSVLGAYTHYFAAISSVVIYVIFFFYILFKEKSKLKNFFISVVTGVILYIPWLLTLINQLTSVHKSYHLKLITVTKLISCFSYIFTISRNHVIQILSLLLVFIIFLEIYKHYVRSKKIDDFYLMMGTLVFFGTIYLGLFLSLTFKPILIERYLIPAIAVFLLCLAIKISHIKSNKLLVLIVILILAMGAFNVYKEYQNILDGYDNTLYEENLLDGINNNDSVIIVGSVNRYVRTYDYLNNVHETYGAYSLNNNSKKLEYSQFNDLNYETLNIPQDLNKYPNKHVFLIAYYKSKINNGNGFKLNEIGEVQHSKIFEIIPN